MDSPMGSNLVIIGFTWFFFFLDVYYYYSIKYSKVDLKSNCYSKSFEQIG